MRLRCKNCGVDAVVAPAVISYAGGAHVLTTVGVWLFFGAIAGAIGHYKGEGGRAFAAGFVMGPFGVLAALLSSGNRRECPACRERMDRRASVCPHCRSGVVPEATTAQGLSRHLEGKVVFGVLFAIALLIAGLWAIGNANL